MEMFEDDSNEKLDVIIIGKVNNDLFYMLIVCILKYIFWEIYLFIYLLIVLRKCIIMKK